MLTTKRRIGKGWVTGRTASGRHVKVWVARNIAGDYYPVKVRIGRFERSYRYAHNGNPAVEELVREYAVAKKRGRR